MITFQQVSKHFGTQAVLTDVSFQVNPGEHVGIIGPNGAGKSTLFNLIVGELQPDKGLVQVPKNARLGYVHQQLDSHKVTASLLEYSENALPELQAVQTAIAALDRELSGELQPGASSPRDKTVILHELGDCQHRFEDLGGYSIKHRTEQALSGLGFPQEWFSQPFRSLSGGWQSRAELARALMAEPDILLLDEPSNYLDIPAIEWLQHHLKEFKGALLLISHDRFLLNSLISVTMEVANACVERYPGNYDYYIRERTLRYDQRQSAMKNQQRKREQLERFIERFRAKSTKAAQVQSRVRQLEKMEAVVLPQAIVSRGKIRLRPPPHCGVEVMRLEQAGLTYDKERWVLQNLDLSIQRGEKIALIGHNGLGKTTLLKMLAGSLPLSEGKRICGHKVITGYQSQDFAETMHPEQTVFETVKNFASNCSDQEVRTLLGGFGFSGDAIEKRVSVLSGGEKIRLAFARLLAQPPNFMLLDEPTTHLDTQAREALEGALQGYQGTLCLVSHDIEFVRHVATGIIAMTPPTILRYPGDYDYYRRKLAEMERGTSAVAGGEDTNKDSDGESGPVTKKDMRRQRAVARQEIYESTRDLKKQIIKAEKQVVVFEEEKNKILDQLADPAQVKDFAGLNRRLKTIQGEIDRYTRLWEDSALQLEELTGARS